MEPYEHLVELAQRRDGEPAEAAFSALIDRFWASAVAWAYALLADFDPAQDAAQEAFIIAYRQLGDLREVGAFPAWLRRIVVSQCIRMLRRRSPLVSALREEEDGETKDDPAAAHEASERRHEIREAVRALPEHERAVTELFYLAGYSQQEIAETLDLPLTTVKKRLQYARERLKTAQPLIEQIYNQLGGYSQLSALDDPSALAEETRSAHLPMGILDLQVYA